MSALDFSTDVAGTVFPNPVMTASGCAGFARELHPFLDAAALGAFVTPTLMARARSGWGGPRTMEGSSGLLHASGLPGPGIVGFCASGLPWLQERGVRVVVSIAGGTGSECGQVASHLRDCGSFGAVAGVEVNLTAPNPATPGQSFAQNPDAAAKVLTLVREQLPRDFPLIAKLTAAVTDLASVAQASIRAGANALTLIGAVPAMAIDVRGLRPRFPGSDAALSGPAVKPVALQAIWQVHRAMRENRVPTVPIVGVGGVRSGRDALEFVAAGASAVQVGAATLRDPRAPLRIRDELAALVTASGFERFADAVGVAHERMDR